MSTRINTNVDAFTAQRNLSMTALTYSKSVQKLSSGLRINSAADDAAGLAISEKLRAQIRGLAQAQRNSQDGISMIQTGEGAMQETTSMLQRMRELAVQASNDTLSSSDRSSINLELQQLQLEVNGISTRTKFNGQGLLDGTLSTSLDTTSNVKVGKVYATTDSVAVTNVDVSGALTNAASTRTFKLTTTATTVTLTDQTDTTKNQTLALADIANNSSGTYNFSQLGISFTMSNQGGAAKVAADQ